MPILIDDFLMRFRWYRRWTMRRAAKEPKVVVIAPAWHPCLACDEPARSPRRLCETCRAAFMQALAEDDLERGRR